MQWKNLRVTFVWLVINRKNKDWLDTDMVEKSITSRMHTWFKQKTKPDQICTVYWSIEKVRSLKKGSRVYRKHVIFDPLCTTWGEQWLNNHTLTCWASSSTRMMSPSSNCSCPSSDAAWFSSATPWCKTQNHINANFRLIITQCCQLTLKRATTINTFFQVWRHWIVIPTHYTEGLMHFVSGVQIFKKKYRSISV